MWFDIFRGITFASTLAYFDDSVVLGMVVSKEWCRNYIKRMTIFWAWWCYVPISPTQGTDWLVICSNTFGQFPPRPKKLCHPPSSLSSLSPSGSPWTSLSWTRVTVRVKATDGVAPRSTTTTTTTRSTRCLIATPVLWKESWGRCYQDLPSSQIAITCHQSYITLPNADSGNTMFRTFLLPISVQHICRPIAVTF